MLRGSRLIIILIPTFIGLQIMALPQSPAGTILRPAAGVYGNYSSLQGVFTSASITLNQATGSTILLANNNPNPFNFNFGLPADFKSKGTAGYSFFGDVWRVNNQASTSYVRQLLIPSVVTSTTWSTGLTFVMLGYDSKNNIITDLTKVAPASFIMFMYNTATGTLLGQVPVNVNDASKSTYFTQPTPTGPWPVGSNSIGIGALSSASITVTYPMALILTALAPATYASLSNLPLTGTSSLTSMISTAGATLMPSAPQTVTSINASPSSFNINFGTTAGYSFIGDAWQQGTIANPANGAVAATLPEAITPDQWVGGVSFVMLAFDSNNNFIPKITKATQPANFYLFIYDSARNLIGKPVPVPLQGASKSKDFISTWSSASNAMGIGFEGVAQTVTATYPAILTIQGTFLQSLKLDELRTALSIAQPLEAQLVNPSAPVFNINFGETAGYSFYGDAWNSGTNGFAADGIFPILPSVSWTDQPTFVMLAFDENDNFIPKITTQPYMFYMFLYDSGGNPIGKPAKIYPFRDSSADTQYFSGNKFKPTAHYQEKVKYFKAQWSDSFNKLGVGGVSPVLGATYPAAFQIN